MLNKVFSPDNLFFRQLGRLADMLILSVLWVFICLPIVTIGPASAALYDCTVRCVRGHEGGTLARFFSKFKECFLQGALWSLIWAAVWASLYWLYQLLLNIANSGDRNAAIFYVAYGILMILPAGVMCWMYPVLSRFQNSFFGLFRVSLSLALRHLPSTVVVVLLASLCALHCAEYRWPIILLPSLAALIWSLFIERILTKYSPDADVLKKVELEDDAPVDSNVADSSRDSAPEPIISHDDDCSEESTVDMATE